MRSFKLPLWMLVVAVVLLAVGFGALRNSSRFWADTFFFTTISILLLGIVGVVSRRGPAQLGFLGFVLFGWAYLILALTSGGIRLPAVPTIDLIESLYRMIQPPERGTVFQGCTSFTLEFSGVVVQDKHLNFIVVAHSMITLLVGLVGAFLARIFAIKPDRPEVSS